MKAGQ